MTESQVYLAYVLDLEHTRHIFQEQKEKLRK